jgi:hypothetical protein
MSYKKMNTNGTNPMTMSNMSSSHNHMMLRSNNTGNDSIEEKLNDEDQAFEEDPPILR